MLAVYDMCRVGKEDDKYLKIMSSVPNAEKYDLFTVDNVLFVPLDQVYDLMKVQPDPDTISRKAAIEALNKEIIKRRLLDDVNDGMLDEFDTEDILRKLPPAQPQRTGRWVKIKEGIKVSEYKCSECGRTVCDDKGYDPYVDYPYCHCGARMEGE